MLSQTHSNKEEGEHCVLFDRLCCIGVGGVADKEKETIYPREN